MVIIIGQLGYSTPVHVHCGKFSNYPLPI